MQRIKDTLGGEPVYFHYCDQTADLIEVVEFVEAHSALGIDTESTGVNCYRPGWELRTYQIGDAYDSYVIPAKHKKFLGWLMRQDVNWIGHNGPHDIRSIDAWLAYDTGVTCAGETFIVAHHHDSRNPKDGGVGHGLKEQAERYVARDAGKWEVELNKAFKAIEIPIPGEVYKSGPRKGQQKVRKANLSEGWRLIDPRHPAYIAYAAADPILTYRLWKHYQPVLRANHELYRFDLLVQEATDKLTRRAMRLDAEYTERLNDAYEQKAQALIEKAASLGLRNINSGMQIASLLQAFGCVLTAKTAKGALKTDDGVLRGIRESYPGSEAAQLIDCILGAKQLLKRKESYTEAFLREADEAGYVHPSIKPLGARTSRMSVSNPPLQQLPTKDREKDVE